MSDSNFTFNMTNMIPSSPATPWKYNEEEIVKELLEYIRGTYTQHYSAGDQKIQTLDLIEADSASRIEFMPSLADNYWIRLQAICGG